MNSENKELAASAELALKTHALAFDAALLAEVPGGCGVMEQIRDAVNLTEAPEDAVCGLVIDLMHYCEQEKIDWDQEVIGRARRHFPQRART